MDAEKVETLLSILDLSRDMPDLKPIFDEAYRDLAVVARELIEEQLKEEKAA